MLQHPTLTRPDSRRWKRAAALTAAFAMVVVGGLALLWKQAMLPLADDGERLQAGAVLAGLSASQHVSAPRFDTEERFDRATSTEGDRVEESSHKPSREARSEDSAQPSRNPVDPKPRARAASTSKPRAVRDLKSITLID